MNRRFQFTAMMTALLCATAVGCGAPFEEERRFEKVERVFMHEPGNYSIYYYDTHNFATPNEIRHQSFRDIRGEVKLFTDVSQGEPMWVRAIWSGDAMSGTYWSLVEIHIHDATDVNLAGWNHGKFGRGQTVVVE